MCREKTDLARRRRPCTWPVAPDAHCAAPLVETDTPSLGMFCKHADQLADTFLTGDGMVL